MFASSLFDAKLPWDWSQQVIKFTRLQRSDLHRLLIKWSENQVQLSSVLSDSQQIGDFPLDCFIPQLFDNFKFPAKINRKPGNSRKISQNSQTRKLEINWNSEQKWEISHWTNHSKKYDKIIGKSLILNRSFFQIDRVSLYNLKEKLELVIKNEKIKR